jgi:tRNA (guanine-N7-)-methyltransferase
MPDDSAARPATAHRPNRAVRSFVLRAGRITDAQQRALTDLWPRYGLDVPDAEAATPFDLDAIFGRSAPRALEIGFGNGENLASLASANPQRDYLGVEVHRPGVGRLMLAAQAAGLTHLRVLCHDAVEVLQRCVAPASLDEVLILFPDPWHKKRHNKRRLVQTSFVDLVASRLRAGGVLELATDWEPYAQQMLEVLGANDRFENLSPDGTWMPRPQWRSVTRFERRGTKLGHGVWDLAFRRR